MLLLALALSARAEEPIRALYPLHGPDLTYEMVSVQNGAAVVWRDGRAYAVDVATGAMSEPGPVRKDDAVRFGLLVGPGPWWSRDHQPRVQPIPGTDSYALRKGEALVLVDTNGIEQAVIVEGWNLDQKERISPDGHRVAWVRYLGASERYSVLAAPILDATYQNTRVADGPGFPMAGPLWSHDSESLYFTSIEDRIACVNRADTEPIMNIWQLQCVGGMQGASLVLSPDGGSAAFVLHKSPSAAEVWWLELPSGMVRSRAKVVMQGTRTDDLLLSDGGLLIARGKGGKGLVVVDLADGATVTLEGSAAFEGLDVSSWIGPHETIALRRTAEGLDVVRIDARAALATRK